MAIPGSVSTRYTDEYVSLFDVHKPDILNSLFARYGDQGMSAFMWFKTMGKKRMVSQTTYYHFEDDLNNPNFQARAGVAAPGAGNPQNITLAAVDLNSLNQFYPQVKDVVYYKGGKQGVITAIDVTTPTAPVITVEPKQAGAAYALPAVAQDEYLSIVSNGHAEGTIQPDGRATSATRFSNQTQIFKNTISATGAELTNQSWIQINGVKDAPWYNTAFNKMEYRQALDISGALMFGVPGDGSVLDPENGLPISYTEGMVTLADRLGNPRTYTPGSYSVTDFDAYSRILDREYVTGAVSYRMGQDHFAELENALVNYGYNTMVDYTKIKPFMDNAQIEATEESLATYIGFSYLQKSGRLYCFSRDPQFTNKQTFGIPGSSTPTLAVITPMGQRKDAASGQMMNSIGYAYKGFGSYSREVELWDTRGAGPGLKVLSQDISNTYIRSEMGFEGFGANQWITVRG